MVDGNQSDTYYIPFHLAYMIQIIQKQTTTVRIVMLP